MKKVEHLFDCPLKKDAEKSHDSAQYDTVRNFRKTRISGRKWNQKQKYFKPLVSGPGQFE